MAKTRKNGKGTMTIPQLRKAFDHMESYTSSLFKKSMDSESRRKSFMKEWRRVFHRPVDAKAADAYLKFEEKKYRKSTHTRKQRGGESNLAGAPLDYSTRPGIYGVYGEFPAYVDSGLDFYDKINIQAPTAGCGVENTTPKVPLSIGSNLVGQKGGKRKGKRNGTRKQRGGFPSISDFAQAFSFRPITASVPTSPLYDLTTSMRNPMNLPASPEPNTAHLNYIQHRPTTLAAVATDITRDLGAEIGFQGKVAPPK